MSGKYKLVTDARWRKIEKETDAMEAYWSW